MPSKRGQRSSFHDQTYLSRLRSANETPSLDTRQLSVDEVILAIADALPGQVAATRLQKRTYGRMLLSAGC